VTSLGCISASPTPSARQQPTLVSSGRNVTLNFRRQPGGFYHPTDLLNFWNLEVRSDGLAILAAEGTALIADGNYAGLIAPDAVAQLQNQVDKLRSVNQPMAMCGHADYFEVNESPFSRNACISKIEASDLAALYIAAQDIIKTVAWRPVCSRPKRN